MFLYKKTILHHWVSYLVLGLQEFEWHCGTFLNLCYINSQLHWFNIDTITCKNIKIKWCTYYIPNNTTISRYYKPSLRLTFGHGTDVWLMSGSGAKSIVKSASLILWRSTRFWRRISATRSQLITNRSVYEWQCNRSPMIFDAKT